MERDGTENGRPCDTKQVLLTVFCGVKAQHRSVPPVCSAIDFLTNERNDLNAR
jgi:hypothetical protein